MNDDKASKAEFDAQLQDLERRFDLGMRDAQRKIDALVEQMEQGRDKHLEALLVVSRRRVNLLEIAIDKACEQISIFKQAALPGVRATPPSPAMIKKDLMDYADKRYQDIYGDIESGNKETS